MDALRIVVEHYDVKELQLLRKAIKAYRQAAIESALCLQLKKNSDDDFYCYGKYSKYGSHPLQRIDFTTEFKKLYHCENSENLTIGEMPKHMKLHLTNI